MNIDDLTIGEARELAKNLAEFFTYVPAESQLRFTPGEKVFVFTINKFFTGVVSRETADDLVLKKAAWIADTGRFANALVRGKFAEVEPYPSEMDVNISKASITDWIIWPHELPREQI